MTIKIALTISFIFSLSVSAFPCSIPYISPWKFDISQYVFVGQITDYVESADLINKRQSPAEASLYGKQADRTAGVKIKVKQSFYLPTSARKDTYEVFRFSLGADCGLYGLPVDWMKERYKIGAWVRVVAGKNEHIANSSDDAIGRLEVRYGKDDWITVLGNDDPLLRDISSVFDYKAYRQSLIGDPSFELLKDLRRLSLANLDERKVILNRLTYYPGPAKNSFFWLDGVFQTYSTDMDEFNRYEHLLKERAMSETEFKDFQQRINSRKP